MKKYILLLFVSTSSFCTMAQIQVVDNFGNKKTVNTGTEPWRIQGATTVATANDQNIYQTGNVGIGDFAATTATQKLDVSGNARVRILANGSNTTNFPNMAVAQSDGTLGKKIISSDGIAAGNTAGNLMVTKRYTVQDFPTGQNANTGFNTNMSSAEWEAIISNIRYTFTTGTVVNAFPPNSGFGYRLTNNGGFWKIIGDIASVNEVDVVVDVLFIKKSLVAADARTN